MKDILNQIIEAYRNLEALGFKKIKVSCPSYMRILMKDYLFKDNLPKFTPISFGEEKVYYQGITFDFDSPEFKIFVYDKEEWWLSEIPAKIVIEFSLK